MADGTKIGFIGGGNMAKAIAKGFISSKYVTASNIIVSATTDKTLDLWKGLGCQTTLINKSVVKNSKIVFLAVKPYQMVQVVEEIKPVVSTEHLIVSVAAAISTEAIEEHLPVNTRVIRVQPNLACSLQCGVLAFCRGTHVTSEDVEAIDRLLRTCGYCVEAKESSLNAISSVSGCSLAFFSQVIEAMSDGGVKVGLPREMAQQLVTQAMVGAARLVQETGRHPGKLKDEVCSPGGTTIAGVQTLERAGLRSALIDAVETATQRAIEIAQQK